MADEHIDNDETQTYGPKLRENLARAFASSAPEVKAFIAYLGALQAEADKKMADGMAKARGATSELSSAAASKGPHEAAARSLLRGVHKHLQSKRELGAWKGDVKLFFPKGLSGIGSGASGAAAALATVLQGFAKDKTVPEGPELKKKVAAVEKKLRAEIESAGSAAAAARSGLSEQSAEKAGWRATYYGIAKAVDAVFTIERRKEAVSTVVPHLAVKSGRKKPRGKAKSGGETPA